jgi:hypothetical protein
MSHHPSPPLSPLQNELLKAFSMQTVDETDLREIRLMLSRYFARKASTMAGQVAESWTQEQRDELANQHQRTPYRPQHPTQPPTDK